MINPYTYATGDPVNHTDPTGQSPEESDNWFTKNILNWKGMPYLDAGIATAVLIGAIAFTISTAGTGSLIPLGLAALGFVSTIPSAADEIHQQFNDGESFMSEEQRFGFMVASVAGAALDLGVGIGMGAYKGYKGYKTWSRAKEKAQYFADARENFNPPLTEYVERPHNPTIAPPPGNTSTAPSSTMTKSWETAVERYRVNSGKNNHFTPDGPEIQSVQHKMGESVPGAPSDWVIAETSRGDYIASSVQELRRSEAKILMGYKYTNSRHETFDHSTIRDAPAFNYVRILYCRN
ncbi:hypothetical protein EES43_18820 [Streptomyces sp. ADI96-02]|nr:hypothetical protein EES43_18820 [Streptomyces sp. ADI96-02]